MAPTPLSPEVIGEIGKGEMPDLVGLMQGVEKEAYRRGREEAEQVYQRPWWGDTKVLWRVIVQIGATLSACIAIIWTIGSLGVEVSRQYQAGQDRGAAINAQLDGLRKDVGGLLDQRQQLDNVIRDEARLQATVEANRQRVETLERERQAARQPSLDRLTVLETKLAGMKETMDKIADELHRLNERHTLFNAPGPQPTELNAPWRP